MSALKFPLPFYIQVSDSSCNFQMAIPHLVCAILFFLSMICFSFLDLVPNLGACPNENEKLMVELRFKSKELKERLKNDAVSNYIPPVPSRLSQFQRGWKKTEVKGWIKELGKRKREKEKERETRGCASSKRAKCRMAGIYYVPVGGRGRGGEEASVTPWRNKNLTLRQGKWCKSQN